MHLEMKLLFACTNMQVMEMSGAHTTRHFEVHWVCRASPWPQLGLSSLCSGIQSGYGNTLMHAGLLMAPACRRSKTLAQTLSLKIAVVTPRAQVPSLLNGLHVIPVGHPEPHGISLEDFELCFIEMRSAGFRQLNHKT